MIHETLERRDAFVVLGDTQRAGGRAARTSYVALNGGAPGTVGIFESVPALQDGLEKGLATPSRSPNTQQGLYRCLRSLQSDEAANPQETLWALIVGIDIDERYDEEFNEWYDTEHLPLLATVEGVARARRYILDQEQALLRPGSPPPRYLAIFELDDPHVPQGVRWHAHVSTPWCDRIFRFRRLLFRTVYARVPAGR